MKKWDPNIKPPANICPESLCDNWMEAGEMIARGFHDSVEDAWDKLEIIEKAGCECSFGKCTRLHGDAGDNDWYDYIGVNLKSVGLPWFYFVPNPSKVSEDMVDEYIRESEKLWGKDHYKK